MSYPSAISVINSKRKTTFNNANQCVLYSHLFLEHIYFITVIILNIIKQKRLKGSQKIKYRI